MFSSIIGFFLLGLSFGAGPCLAACGPLLLSYIAGTEKSVSGSFVSYLVFSAARISAYLAIGFFVFFLGRLLTGGLLGAFSRYVLILGGGFVISVGVLIISGKRIQSRFCDLLRRKFLEEDRKSLIIFGLIIGLAPCAPLLAVFSYMGLISRDWLSSLAYSFSFGIGTLISPLLVLAAITGIIPRFLNAKPGIYERIFHSFCGGILVISGIQLIRRAF